VDATMEKWAAELARLEEFTHRIVEETRKLEAFRVEDAAQTPPDVRGLPYRVPLRLAPSQPSSSDKVRQARCDAIWRNFRSICDTPLRGVAMVVPTNDIYAWDIAHFILLKDYGDCVWTVEFTFPDDYPSSKPTVRLHPARGNDCQPDYWEVNSDTRVVGVRMYPPYQVRDILLELLNLSAESLILPPGHKVQDVVGPDNRVIRACLEDLHRDPPNGVAVVLPHERTAWGASHYIQIRDYNGRMWRVQFILSDKYARNDALTVKLYPTFENNGKPEHPLVQPGCFNRREVNLGDQLPFPCSMRKILLVILNQTVPVLQLSDADLSAADEYLRREVDASINRA
jgi:ubiquitin-protein ligase